MKLRYITRVDLCPARHVSHARPLPDGVHVYMPSYVPWEPVCIEGLASLEVTDAVEDGVRTFTSKLSVTLSERPAMAAGPVVYRLTCADGTQLLLGTAARPYPTATVTDTHSARPSDTCACTLTATWTGRSAPQLIVV